MRYPARRRAAPEPAGGPSPAARWTALRKEFRPAAARSGRLAQARKMRRLAKPPMLPPSRRKVANYGCRSHRSFGRFRRWRDKAGGIVQGRRGATRIGQDRVAKRNEIGPGANKIADRAEIVRVTNARNVEDFRPPGDALHDAGVRLSAAKPAEHH